MGTVVLSDGAASAPSVRRVLVAGLCALSLAAFSVLAVAHAAPGAAEASTPKGWHKVSGGKKAYYRNGERVTGVQKIGKYRYFFNGNGVLVSKNTKAGKTKYYVNPENSHIEGMKLGSTYYYANGYEMTKADAMDFAAFQHARQIIAKITKPSQSKAQKRLACFKYAMKDYYAVHRSWDYWRTGWSALYAQDRFNNKGGDCITDAAAFAYLAAALGYKDVCIGVDGARIRDPHSWAMIGNAVYDPLFAVSKSFSQYYGATHGIYQTNPGARRYVPYFNARHAKKTAKGKGGKGAKRDLSKAGLTKVKGKLYYYSDGVKLKGTWKRVGKKRYHFNGKGVAATGPARIKKVNYVFSKAGVLQTGSRTRLVKVGSKSYRVDKKGRAVSGLGSDGRFCRADGELLCGVDVIKGKFYAASASGIYDAALTAKLRAAAVRDQPVAPLVELLGEPRKKVYGDNCEGIGPNAKDGVWTYPQFTMTTLDPGDDTPERFRTAE